MNQNKLRIIPLGGVGEIGKNLTVLEYNDDVILVDCGLLFPEPEMMGVDLVIPDVTYLTERIRSIRGIFMTHGHEDHTGALPYVLPQIDFPTIHATKLTAGLIRVKLKEHRLTDMVEVKVFDPDDTITAGAFKIGFFRVNHSIPDAVGLIIRTPAGIVVHTGDFKFDQTPVDGRRTEFNKLSALGDEGVTVLLSDSTNSERTGYTASEMVVGTAIKRTMAEAKGRVILATFASLIARIQQVLDAAEATDRKVTVVGRSMVDNVAMALELGYLKSPPNILVKPDEIVKLPDREVAILTTGSQGEPTSALTRMANADHRQIKIKAGDTVLISASPIPGNEELVNRTVNSLFKQGAIVVHSGNAQVHVSGHAAQEEQKMMLALTRPTHFVPVHGEWRHLITHSQTAVSMGVAPENVFVLENGNVLEVDRSGARIAEQRVPAGYVYVDGLVGDIGHVVLRDRKALANDGIFVVMVAIDQRTGRVVGRPEIVSRGFIDMRESEELIEAVKTMVIDELGAEGDHRVDWGFVNKKLKDSVSKFLFERTRRRPMVLPVPIEV